MTRESTQMAVQTLTGAVDAPHWESFVVGSVTSYLLRFDSLMRKPILASNTVGYVEVTTWPDGRVCCGSFNSSCCNGGQGYNINANGQVQGSLSTETAESSTTASSTPYIRPLSSQSPADNDSLNNQSDSSNSLGIKQQVAIGVVVPTVVVVIALLAWRLPKVSRRTQ